MFLSIFAATKPESIVLSLEYACLHWIDHVSNLPDPLALSKDFNDALRPRFLFWLEVMSVLDQVPRAGAMLIVAATTVRLPSRQCLE